MANDDEQRRFERKFGEMQIDCAAPGFCDSAAFMAAEVQHPSLILDYGRYVRIRELDAGYVERVRRRVSELVVFLRDELAADGRLGACIDASAVALRFLEMEGIWGCRAVGSVVVDFGNQLGRRFLQHFMHPNNPAAAGHSWLCVPPFEIVDLTIQAQPRLSQEQRARLRPVFAERVDLGTVDTVEEVAEPELRALFLADVGRPARLEDFASPAMRQYWAENSPKVVTTDDATLKYIECGIAGGDGIPLEQMNNLVLSGRPPAQLHARFIEHYPEQ